MCDWCAQAVGLPQHFLYSAGMGGGGTLLVSLQHQEYQIKIMQRSHDIMYPKTETLLDIYSSILGSISSFKASASEGCVLVTNAARHRKLSELCKARHISPTEEDAIFDLKAKVTAYTSTQVRSRNCFLDTACFL